MFVACRAGMHSPWKSYHSSNADSKRTRCHIYRSLADPIVNPSKCHSSDLLEGRWSKSCLNTANRLHNSPDRHNNRLIRRYSRYHMISSFRRTAAEPTMRNSIEERPTGGRERKIRRRSIQRARLDKRATRLLD